MDERQRRIEESQLEAAREKESAVKEREEFEQKKRELESKRDALLQEATDEAEAERARLRKEAREEFLTLRERWKRSLHSDQENLKKELAILVQRETLATTKQLAHDLADADFQDMVVQKFVEKLKSISKEDRENLREPLAESGHSVVVRSAFPLEDGPGDEVREAVHEVLGTEPPINFEVRPSLGAGVELAVDGRKACWTIEGYLTSLENGVRELVKKETGGKNEPGTE